MGDDFFGAIPGSDIPQTSSLEPTDYPYGFPSNEQSLIMVTQRMANPHSNTGEDDVAEW